MKTEGQAESGTGYNGNSFSIDIGNADDFDRLAEIIKELAQEEGIKDLSVNKDFFGNMDISGFSDSPEEQAIFAKVMSRALVEYQNQLSKSGISS
jgi:microsomal dipeptidase-like Zn-dependent dipeptidase